MRKLETSPPPAPSAELILIAGFVQAHIATLPRKQADRFLKIAKDKFGQYCELAEVPRLRASEHDAALAHSILQAEAWYRASLPVFLAAIAR